MAGRVHKLTFTENSNSYPQYRSEVNCVCGFSGKLARPELALSQGIAHLQYNGLNLNDPLVKYHAGLPLTEAEQVTVRNELVSDRQRMIDANKVPGAGSVKPILTKTPKLIAALPVKAVVVDNSKIVATTDANLTSTQKSGFRKV
jgi:hypothetical protein